MAVSPPRACWLLGLLLAGCGPAGTAGEAGIDTSALWPLEDGSFLAYRHLTPEAYADPAHADVLDESDLLLARYEAGGCGSGRVELRAGGSWADAAPAGALQVEDGLGLAICAYEAGDGTLHPFDPPVKLWIKGSVLEDGGVVESGAWRVTARRAAEVPTYFGTFPQTVVFGVEGDGALDGWELHLAEGFGPVVMATGAFTADLVYAR